MWRLLLLLVFGVSAAHAATLVVPQRALGDDDIVRFQDNYSQTLAISMISLDMLRDVWAFRGFMDIYTSMP
jgi:hypothetical protein